jgi:Mg2+-importing ATPase
MLQVIVKRLDAVQNLGVVTCCCTDKTGTLTVDRVQLNASLSPFNEPSSLPRKLGFVNASLQTGSRSLLDQAITSAMGMGPADLMSVQKLGEIPFDSERRIMSVVVCAKDISGASQPYVVSKGAVDEILDRCTRYTAADEAMFVTRGVRPLDPGVRSEIHRTEAALNGDGHRLIAVAWRKCHGAFLTTEDAEHVSSDEERDLIFAGFLAFLDPPKADAADAVQDLLDLSINVGPHQV